MKINRIWVGVVIAVIAGLIVLTALLVPTNVPAYDAAVEFAHAAGHGEEAVALALLTPALQDWVTANCRDNRVSACVDDYTPPDWGNMLSVVYRRAQPAGVGAFDVQLVATYEDNQGFSGVCIYNQVVQQPDGRWLVARWSGWESCDDPNSGLSSLISNPAVPNRAP